MSKKIYTHLGYYSYLNDILRLCDKLSDYVVEDMLKDNGCFHETDGCELDENSLACYFPTFVKVNGKEYAVIRDIDWTPEELFKLDADSDADNDWYDKNPAFIDVYVLKEMED